MWALHTSVANRPSWHLGGRLRDAVYWAQELAWNPRLTLGDVASREGLAPATIRSYMRQARRELFGTISDSAIYKRDRRWKDHKRPDTCAEDGCENPPAPKIVREDGLKAGQWPKYCREHGTPTARRARHERRAST